jgi:cytoskeletal protein CcmA (bactofilin family)
MARPQTRTDSREAVIGRSTRVRGRISGEGSLLVEGAVEGDVTVTGDLVVGDAARLASNVDASTVTVRGELEGDIRARGVVRVEAGGRVRGDVSGEALALEDGAEFVGRIDAEFDLPAELGGGATTGGGRRR